MMLLPMAVMLALVWLVAQTPPATAAHDALWLARPC